jgi:hypothetical protein
MDHILERHMARQTVVNATRNEAHLRQLFHQQSPARPRPAMRRKRAWSHHS